MGFLGFGKKHTRERYETVKEDAKSAREAYRWTGSGTYTSGGFKEWSQEHYDRLFNDAHEAENRLKKLYQQGHKEALALDKKYNAMVDKLAYDVAELYSFEKKELGMHRGEKAKKNVGSLVGVISIASFILASFLAINLTGNVTNLVNGNVILNPSLIFLLSGMVCGIAWLFLKD